MGVQDAKPETIIVLCVESRSSGKLEEVHQVAIKEQKQIDKDKISID